MLELLFVDTTAESTEELNSNRILIKKKMNVIFDNIFNTFLYFRLGSKDNNNSCKDSLYVDIDNDNDNGTILQHDKLPELKENYYRVCVISDTHERHSSCNIPNCDILVHAGDILMTSRFISDMNVKENILNLMNGLDY